MASKPVNLIISRVWWSEREPVLPLTVFSTATLDRLHHLEALCRMLPGAAVSGAVFLPLVQRKGGALAGANADLLRAAQKRLQDLHDRLEWGRDSTGSSTTGSSATRTIGIDGAGATAVCSLHLVLLTEVTSDPGLAALVPINSLRNVALLAARTPLVAMIDVDLAPCEGLAGRLLRDVSRVQGLQAERDAMWVLPAWESSPQLAQAEAEAVVQAARTGDKPRLAALWSSHRIRTFSEDVYARGHNATDFSRWLRSPKPYVVQYETGYEPWGIVAREHYLQWPFDERFRGCFRDKVTQVASLARSARLRFTVLPDAWLIHQPHLSSAAAQIAFNRTNITAGGGGGRGGGAAGTGALEAAAAARAPADKLAEASQAHVRALQKMVRYRGLNTTKFTLHKAHSMLTSDGAYAAMAAGAYKPAVGGQWRACAGALPWLQQQGGAGWSGGSGGRGDGGAGSGGWRGAHRRRGRLRG
ncbi:hypothetical protein CHLRE_07g316400v5 [Chlamydomonas reinhardtii]|uniref:Uncharacterized protein n=1 Tax=Chlamydomonas reinhardtii TaxID=3055 RepID=A0A2K3DIQ3_CHLRE|nr:uncharacterized protein CHLRE_07g316400v5 [Chlamydomonas reinhardtii]PNW80405.1 hypothetical protein CHLRE_07g316400v5 [Chlamydomonas reinhardtii]